MANMITGFYINPYTNTAKEVTVEDSLQSLYKLLNCNLIEVASRRIGVRNKHYYDIICDEQGTFIDDPIISAINDLGFPRFVGSIFICNHDDEGNFASLTSKQIANVKKHVMLQGTIRHPEPHYMLMQCEY